MSYKPKQRIKQLEDIIKKKDLEISALNGELKGMRVAIEKLCSQNARLMHDGFRLAYKSKF